jgi:hypothetical protein
MNANYASKISIAMPFVSALVGFVTAMGAHAGILMCIISALGGFVVGFCMGALSVGLSGLFLTRPDRSESSLVLFGSLTVYFLVPLIFLAASCVATVLGLKWIL